LGRGALHRAIAERLLASGGTALPWTSGPPLIRPPRPRSAAWTIGAGCASSSRPGARGGRLPELRAPPPKGCPRPVIGEVTLADEELRVTAEPGQMLLIFTAERVDE
jgi:hypothetical protein